MWIGEEKSLGIKHHHIKMAKNQHKQRQKLPLFKMSFYFFNNFYKIIILPIRAVDIINVVTQML